MPAPGVAIEVVNELDLDAFVAVFGGVFESTPALAATAWSRRPFRDRAALVDAFRSACEGLDDAGVLALLRAHPPLAVAGPLTDDSANEQRAAGLTELGHETRERIVTGNARYLERFGFPFIIAVRGLGPSDIVAALDRRLARETETEQATAVEQVQRIAELRIAHLVAPPP